MKTINLKDILSIAGKGGLFKYIAQARNGIVVESLDDGKRHVAPATARVSSLEDIAIFTAEDEVPLSDVFARIHESTEGGEAISHKVSSEELKSSFEALLPDYDEERVYVSDIKKVFQWYNQLHSHELLELVEKEEEKEEGEEPEKNKEAEAGKEAEASKEAETNKEADTKNEAPEPSK